MIKHNALVRRAHSFVWQIIDVVKSFYVRLVSRARIADYLKTHQVKKLHLGAGGNILKDWCNTDITPDLKTGVYLDLRKRFSFADNTFDYIFSEHTMEHLELRVGIASLKESFRVLKPGGKIRIAMPNLAYLIELYNPQKTEIQLREIKRIVDMVFPDVNIYQDVFVINNFFKNWGHKFIYDYKLLKELLERAGFTHIVRCEVGQSGDSHLQGLEAHGKFISEEINKLQTFIVEGTKA